MDGLNRSRSHGEVPIRALWPASNARLRTLELGFYQIRCGFWQVDHWTGRHIFVLQSESEATHPQKVIIVTLRGFLK